MKVVVVINKPVVKLPEVGQMWKHGEIDTAIYMRIRQESGERVFGVQGGKFYSINLDNGNLVHTDMENHDIILLEPVGGTLEVKPIS